MPPIASGTSMRSRVVPGDGGDDRPLLPGYRIEQARLSGIRRARDDDPDAVLAAARRAAGRATSRKLVRQAPRIARERLGRRRRRPRRHNRSPPRPAPTGRASRSCHPSTWRRSPPSASASAARRWLSVSASSRSASPSASVRSMRPFSKARRVNSPGSAARSPSMPAKRVEHRIDHRAAAMALEFHDILAGRAGRAVEAQDQRLVEQLAVAGSRSVAQRRRRGGSGRSPASARAAACASGPLIRMTAIAAGGRPLDSAKIVSRSRARLAQPRLIRRTAGRARPAGRPSLRRSS